MGYHLVCFIDSPLFFSSGLQKSTVTNFLIFFASLKTAAMEVLELIGFCEDVVSDEIGRAETYLVLKRNDPSLPWLAKSSLEVSTIVSPSNLLLLPYTCKSFSLLLCGCS